VQSWLDQPNTRLIQPTDRHWVVFQQVLAGGQAMANLVTDAHLAALAMEHDCELNSTDSDFSRFSGLRWKNPLK
jgi:predicted nucleic acid-binding protein